MMKLKHEFCNLKVEIQELTPYTILVFSIVFLRIRQHSPPPLLSPSSFLLYSCPVTWINIPSIISFWKQNFLRLNTCTQFFFLLICIRKLLPLTFRFPFIFLHCLLILLINSASLYRDIDFSPRKCRLFLFRVYVLQLSQP